MVNILGKTNSILNNFIAELRDVNTQTDSMRFRRNLERVGELFAYEISKTMRYSQEEIETQLGVAKMNLLQDDVVLGTILRAGLPLHNGLLNYFDKAENSIISAYRKHSSETVFDIQVEYLSSCSLQDKTLILCDPMLASGMSMVSCYKVLTKQCGIPRQTHIVTVIASDQGLEFCRHNLPGTISYWIGALDPELNAKSYIVPGLGDAGDLAYGIKL